MADPQVFASTPPTPAMGAVGLSFSGVLEFAKKSVKLLQDHGDEVIGLVDAGFRAFKAVTGKDFATLFLALNDANRNAQAIIDAVKAEFGI